MRGRERFAELFAKGRRAAAGNVAARALANPDGATRVAAVAGKALGNAVKRNRLRRRIRAAYRMQKDALPKGCDIALLARPGLLEASWRDVMRDVRKTVERAAKEDSSPRRPDRPE